MYWCIHPRRKPSWIFCIISDRHHVQPVWTWLDQWASFGSDRWALCCGWREEQSWKCSRDVGVSPFFLSLSLAERRGRIRPEPRQIEGVLNRSPCFTCGMLMHDAIVAIMKQASARWAAGFVEACAPTAWLFPALKFGTRKRAKAASGAADRCFCSITLCACRWRAEQNQNQTTKTIQEEKLQESDLRQTTSIFSTWKKTNRAC